MISEDLAKAEAEDYKCFNPEDNDKTLAFKKHNYIVIGILITVILLGTIFGFVIYG